MSTEDKKTFFDLNKGDSTRKNKMLWVGVAFICLTVVVAAIIVFLSVKSKEQVLEENLSRQETTLATGRIQNISLWLSDLEQQGERIVNSEIFRLFASDVNLLKGDISVLFSAPHSLPSSQMENVQDLVSQLPMMRNMLREFTTYSGFISSRIINSKGETYISSETAVPRLSPVQMGKVKEALESGKTTYSPIYSSSNGLVMDMFMPIFPPQIDEENSSKPISVLLLSKIITSRLIDLLAESPLVAKDMTTCIVQHSLDGFQVVDPTNSERTLKSLPSDFLSPDDSTIPFSVRTGIKGNKVYCMGLKVPNVDWWLIQEIDYGKAREGLSSYRRGAIGVASLISLVILLVVSLLWWYFVGREQKKITNEVTDLLQYISAQKELLDRINEAIPDLISLTDNKGVVQYANKAFADSVGRSIEQVIGLDMPALFGFDTAKRLTAPDYKVLMGGESVVINEVVYLQSTKHNLQISKSPYKAVEDQKIKGVVSVYRDITELVDAQIRSQRVVQQTIEALVYAIEKTDFYLGGHSRFMSHLSGMLARAMNLSENNINIIESAAMLSQIGKMFIPKEILNKPGALTEEEKHIMESHVEHSRNVLSNIEFDLPIVDAIYEMNERLDGTGYPRHLTDESISMPARVLAVTNAFTAMVRPRSYRKALAVNEALEILRKQTGSYDQNVLESLEALLKTPAGEKLLQTLQSSDK